MSLSTELVRESCIQCGATGLNPIFWIGVRGVPHGHEGHYIAHSYQVIMKCQSCKQLQLEKFDHDCWSADEEPDMYWWYTLNEENSLRLEEMLKSCPDTGSHECNCQTHQAIRTSIKELFSLVRPGYYSSCKAQSCWLTLKEQKWPPHF